MRAEREIYNRRERRENRQSSRSQSKCLAISQRSLRLTLRTLRSKAFPVFSRETASVHSEKLSNLPFSAISLFISANSAVKSCDSDTNRERFGVAFGST